MRRIAIGIFFAVIMADLKVGSTYEGVAGSSPPSVVMPSAMPAWSIVEPTFRSALAAQQKPGAQKQPPRPRLFAPQDLGLLEPPDREAWQKPDQVMDALHIAEGTTVADIGAGGGWFTTRLARRVWPNGRVYAVDVQELMIQAIERRVQREGLSNIVTPVLGDDDDPRLPTDARLDAFLIVDAFHEMEHPIVWLRNAARTLKPQGRIGIIDYREGEGGPGPSRDERRSPSVVISQAAAAGLKLVQEEKFLPYQYFLIFGK